MRPVPATPYVGRARLVVSPLFLGGAPKGGRPLLRRGSPSYTRSPKARSRRPKIPAQQGCTVCSPFSRCSRGDDGRRERARPFGVAGEMASLPKAAGSAVRHVWLTVECSNCGEHSRVEAPIPAFARGCRDQASASQGARPSASGGGDSCGTSSRLCGGYREDVVGGDERGLRRGVRHRDRRTRALSAARSWFAIGWLASPGTRGTGCARRSPSRVV